MSDNNINVTAPLHAATKKGKLGTAKEIFLEGDTQTVEKEIQDINSRHNDLSSKHESLNSTVSEHTKQIESNQSQITANKSAQDKKNTSLETNMAKLNTRDDQITELVKGVTATGGASIATTVTYDNTSSQLASATVQGAVDELQGSKIDKISIVQELGKYEDKVISQKTVSENFNKLSNKSRQVEDISNLLSSYHPEISSMDSGLPTVNNDTYTIAVNKYYVYKIYNIPNGANIVRFSVKGQTLVKEMIFLDATEKVIAKWFDWNVKGNISRTMTIPQDAKTCIYRTHVDNNSAFVEFLSIPTYDYYDEILNNSYISDNGNVAAYTNNSIKKIKVTEGMTFLPMLNNAYNVSTTRYIYAFYSDYDRNDASTLIEAGYSVNTSTREYMIKAPLGAKALLLSYRGNCVVNALQSKDVFDILNASIEETGYIAKKVDAEQGTNNIFVDFQAYKQKGLPSGKVGEELSYTTSSSNFKCTVLDIPDGVNVVKAKCQYSSQTNKIVFLNSENIIVGIHPINNNGDYPSIGMNLFKIPEGAKKMVHGINNEKYCYVEFMRKKFYDCSEKYLDNTIIKALDGTLGMSSVHRLRKIPVTNVSHVYIEHNPYTGVASLSGAFYSSDNTFNSSTFISPISSFRTKGNERIVNFVEVPQGAVTLLVDGRFHQQDYTLDNKDKNSIYAKLLSVPTEREYSSIFEYVNKDKIEALLLQSTRQMNLNGGETLTKKPVCFLWFTDIHQDQINLKRIIEFRRYFNKYIDDALHTGDGHNYCNTDPSTIGVVEGGEYILDCIGNHDAYNGTDGSALVPVSDANEIFMSQWKDRYENWNAVFPSNSDGNKVCYYHKDYPDSSLRLVVLDEYHVTDSQKEWFKNILTEAKEMGFSVVVASHSVPDNIDIIECGFSEIPQRGRDYTTRTSWAADTIDEFINNGGDFVSWLCGHMHRDFVGVAKNHPNQTIIVETTARMYMYGSNDFRKQYTQTQDAFTVLTIDTENKLIKMIRIGNEYDPYLRHKFTLCLNYSTKKVLADS